MFERPDNTYVISDESISAITNDISNPINQIQKILFDNYLFKIIIRCLVYLFNN